MTFAATKHLFRAAALAAVWLGGVLALTCGAAGDGVTLTSTATAEGQAILLRELGRLEGPEALRFADMEVGRFAGSDEVVVTMEQARQKLSEQGANWGKLSIRGALSVKVRRVAKQPSIAGEVREGSASVSTEAAEGVPAVRTVRQLLTDWVVVFCERDAADLKIEFDDEKDPTLGRTNLRHRYVFSALTGRVIGKRQIVEVKQFLGNELVEARRVRLSVEARQTVLVARQDLVRGQVVTEGDVRVETRWMESPDNSILRDKEQAVGLRVVVGVRVGEPIAADRLTPPELVKRNQQVKVTCISGNVQLETVARALEGGALGQWIRVRDERTQKQFTVQVSGPGLAKVTLQPSGPDRWIDKKKPAKAKS